MNLCRPDRTGTESSFRSKSCCCACSRFCPKRPVRGRTSSPLTMTSLRICLDLTTGGHWHTCRRGRRPSSKTPMLGHVICTRHICFCSLGSSVALKDAVPDGSFLNVPYCLLLLYAVQCPLLLVCGRQTSTLKKSNRPVRRKTPAPFLFFLPLPCLAWQDGRAS